MLKTFYWDHKCVGLWVCIFFGTLKWLESNIIVKMKKNRQFSLSLSLYVKRFFFHAFICIYVQANFRSVNCIQMWTVVCFFAIYFEIQEQQQKKKCKRKKKLLLPSNFILCRCFVKKKADFSKGDERNFHAI